MPAGMLLVSSMAYVEAQCCGNILKNKIFYQPKNLSTNVEEKESHFIIE